MHHTPDSQSPYGMHMHDGEQYGVTHKQQIQDMCNRYHHHYVKLEGTDGNVYEGILDGVDQDQVYILVPVGDAAGEEHDYRQFYPYFGSPYGYGYGVPRRFRRFRRHRFPFFFFRRLFFPTFY